jgi:hypothetical protein
LGSSPTRRSLLNRSEQECRCPHCTAGSAPSLVADSAPVHEVVGALRLPGMRWFNEEVGGGNRVGAIIGQAAIAVYLATNGRSGTCMGCIGWWWPPDTGQRAAVPAALRIPGPVTAIRVRGPRPHERFGTTQEQLGRIAIQLRANAVDNPRAVMRTPITMDDYLSARPIITTPFRLLDCCLDGPRGWGPAWYVRSPSGFGRRGWAAARCRKPTSLCPAFRAQRKPVERPKGARRLVGLFAISSHPSS